MSGSDTEVSGEAYEVACPHCKKTFRGKLLSGSASRYQGFKCRHCKLFIPLERVADQLVADVPAAPPQISPST